MAELTITFTTQEVEQIILAHVASMGLPPGLDKLVSFNIQKGSWDPREPSYDSVSGITVRLVQPNNTIHRK